MNDVIKELEDSISKIENQMSVSGKIETKASFPGSLGEIQREHYFYAAGILIPVLVFIGLYYFKPRMVTKKSKIDYGKLILYTALSAVIGAGCLYAAYRYS